jgi:putative spermidine/putrescine transport system substrate-binding protein
VNDLYPQATVAGVNGCAVTFDHVALIYNTQQIKSAPTSWNAIWDASYKGKIVVPGIPDTMGILVTVIATKLAGGDTSGDLAKGWQKMVELAPLVQTWDPKPDAFPFIINGTGVIGTGWNARAQYWHTDSKGVLGVALPKEGSVMQINMINLVAGSKNQAAAELFINFALSPQAQKSFTEAMFYGPTNKKAEISPEALARTGAAAMPNMIPLDWIELARTREQFTQQWRRVVLPASR